ncbi:MAG: hypothetical protein HOG49_31690 [Candidatus Scalindua sp.]|nr:hypothetical protein [Candidatus Scalindua sp.]
MKAIGIFLLVVLLLGVMLSFAFGAEWLGIAWKGYFGPKHAAVERKIFKETRSFTEGKAQDLSKIRTEFMRLKPEDVSGKKALAGIVRMNFADFDPSTLNPELRRFLTQMMNYR